MKNKINVEVIVPSINESYSIFIPVNKTIGEIIKLLNSAINNFTEGEFPIKNNLSLIDLNSCCIYNLDYSVKANKMKNGSRLILI